MAPLALLEAAEHLGHVGGQVLGRDGAERRAEAPGAALGACRMLGGLTYPSPRRIRLAHWRISEALTFSADEVASTGGSSSTGITMRSRTSLRSPRQQATRPRGSARSHRSCRRPRGLGGHGVPTGAT